MQINVGSKISKSFFPCPLSVSLLPVCLIASFPKNGKLSRYFTLFHLRGLEFEL